MRFSTVLLTALALSTTALAANTRVVATKVEGVTMEQIKAATTPINVAKFEHNGGHLGVRCAGSTGQLVCDIWNLDTNTSLAGSSEVKLCKDGNDFALMGEKMGAGKMIVLPGGVFLGDPSKAGSCGG
jgi:hypothetical protein